MMDMELDIGGAIQQIERIENVDIHESGHNALVEVMAKLEEHAVRFCPVDTGFLRASIHTVWIDPFHAVLQDGTNYGIYVEFGTEPHEIKPFDKMALNFMMGGEEVFAKKVYHPGTRPQPFFRPARELVMVQDIPVIVDKYFGHLTG
jgi:hypothetical protein